MHAVRFYTPLSSTAVCQFLLIKNDDDDDDDDDANYKGTLIFYRVDIVIKW